MSLTCLWTEVGEAQILGPELIQETTRKSFKIKQRMQAARDRQKSYMTLKRKQWNSNRDKVMLKVSPWKGVPDPLDGLNMDDKLHFVEEPVEIVDREVKRLKRSRIPLVKVRWNSKRGPDYSWRRGRPIQEEISTLITKTTPSSSVCNLTLRTRLFNGEILLKMNLPDNRSVLKDLEVQAKMEMEIPRSSGVNSPPHAHTLNP
ncbi:hypothetical protein Tco_0316874 [Tanacetum coccineum]